MIRLKRLHCLQRMPIFGAIRDEALQFLLQQAQEVSVPAGQCFFHEKDPANSMFVLDEGEAVVVKDWQGRAFVLHRLGAGDCFGEMALMDLLPRSASVRAQKKCHAIELTSANLLRLFEHDAEQFALIQMNIGREVCRRLRATDELLFRVSMGDAGANPQAHLIHLRS
jgi:CRP/FNR family transcriptional regulator, cyclic AMP receptor protein